MKNFIFFLILMIFFLNNPVLAQTGTLTDTLAYLKTLEARKAEFIGQPFSKLLNELKINIIKFGPIAGNAYDIKQETSTLFKFIPPASMAECNFIYLDVDWKSFVDIDKSGKISAETNTFGKWTANAKLNYENAIIDDIAVYSDTRVIVLLPDDNSLCSTNFKFTVSTTDKQKQSAKITGLYADINYNNDMVSGLTRKITPDSIIVQLPYYNPNGTVRYTLTQAADLAATAINAGKDSMRAYFKLNPGASTEVLIAKWIQGADAILKGLASGDGIVDQVGPANPVNLPGTKVYMPCIM